ncbi:MAG: immunoglobulin domain-containing protein [Verrucomicrobia bacterium]|nr:immunoglobulin domain-containing protein [Verrucomicrobiota bacterium]
MNSPLPPPQRRLSLRSCLAGIGLFLLVAGAYAQAPANDNFANAQVLAAGGGTLSADSTNATLEAGEGSSPTNTLWYSWTPATSGRMQITTTQANNGMVRYVYTGSSLTNLLHVANVWGGTGVPLTFNATAGTTYRIMIGASGTGSAGVFTLSWGATSLVPPTISSLPLSVSVAEGGTTTLSVTATGPGVLSYSWYRMPAGPFGENIVSNNSTFSGATTASLTITGVTPAMNGDRYRCYVDSNTVLPGAGSNYATLLVVPVITAQPASQTGTVGGSATFAVAASGGSLTYQWFRNGQALAGATGATLALTNLQVADVGSYYVRVSNGANAVASNAATLSGTNAVPAISTQPQNTTVTAGQAVVLSVAANGAAPLAYQWRRNGLPVSGATSATYPIASASRSDADFYDVLVYSGLTPATSQRVRLSVAPTSYPGAVAFDRSTAALLEDANSGGVQQLVALAGGKFLAAGDFASIDGQRRLNLARFNADGSLDATFTGTEIDDIVLSAATQTDGKILICGYFTRVGGLSRAYLSRLNADGTLDASFNLAAGSNVYSLVPQTDGKILLCGYFTSLGGQTRNRVARLNADGTLDSAFVPPDFNTGVYRVAPASGGKVIVAGWFSTVGGQARTNLARLNADGTLDVAFDPAVNSQVESLALQSDGKILIGGYFSTVGGQTRNRLARLNADGSVDAGFNPGMDNAPEILVVQSDNRLLVGGYFWTIAGQSRYGLVRLNADGTLDTTFNPAPNSSVIAVLLPGDGSVLAGGYFTSIGGQTRNRLARLNADGTAQAGVNSAFRATGDVRALAHAPGGKIYVGGRFTHRNGQSVSANLMRLNADGTVDTAYASAPNGTVAALALQGDGRLVVGGWFGSIGGLNRSMLARLNADGTADPAFGNPAVGGWVYAVAVQPDGKVVFGGEFSQVSGQTRNRIARVNSDGSLDTAFDPNVTYTDYYWTVVQSVAVQPDGKVVFGGRFSTVAGQTRNYLARVNADGTLDTAFNANVDGYVVYTLNVQSDGKLLLGGDFYSVGGTSRNGIARLNADGTLDTSHNANNAGFGYAYSLLPQEDGRLIAAGYSSLARLNADGTRDTAFQFAAGASGFRPAYTMLLSDSGQLWVGGSEDFGYGLARLLPATAPVISAQPISQTASPGGTVTFSVTATGTPTPTYQWNLNGAPLAGATNAALTLTNVQLPHAGAYTVTVANGIGTVTSNAATLGGTNAAPTITSQPQNTTVTSGQTATLSVTATGAGTLAYQWRRNGYAIAGATAASYAIAGATRALADTYDVVINDGLSVRVSAPARLSVAPTSYPGAVAFDRTNAVLLEDANGGYVNHVLPLAGGKSLVAGEFISVNGQRRAGLARFNADGTLDPTFAPAEVNDTVNMAAVQTDGKILICGYFSTVGGQSRWLLARVNSDGSLDSSFNLTTSSDVYSVVAQPDGKIILCGYFTTLGGQTRNRVARLNADGTLDAGFVPPVMDTAVNRVAPQSDGKVVIGGWFTTVDGVVRNRIARLNADGSLDTSFDPNANNEVRSLAVQPDGKIVLGGYFTSVGGTTRNRVARLNADGTLDAAFDPNASSTVRTIAVQTDGKILLGGSFGSVGGQSRSQIARVNADGTLDTTFNPGNGGTVQSIAVAADGSILVGGYFSTIGGQTRSRVARLSAAGTPDAAFAPTLRASGYLYALAHAPGGKVYAGGYFTHVNGTALSHLARFNADGSIDPAFSPAPNSEVRALALQGDGKLLVGGGFGAIAGQSRNCFARLNADGTLDAGIRADTNGSLYTIAVQPDGRIVFGGDFSNVAGQTRNRVARVGADGTLDTGFDPNANSTVRSLAVQPDGKIILGGHFGTVAGQTRSYLARVNADGTLDPAFNASVNGYAVYALNVQSDGKLLFGGDFYSVGGTSRNGVARLNADGTLDTDYTSTNVGMNFPFSLLPQEDGRLIAAGYGLSRLNADGTRDTAFQFAAGASGFRPAYTMLLSDSGQLWVGGSEDYGYGLARLLPATAPVISAQPISQTAGLGGTVTFSVTATGTPTPTYQWNLNGASLAGATTAALTLTNLQLAHAGAYTVTVANGIGTVTSNAVTLSGTSAAPTISTQPAFITATSGQPATLSVTASGTGTLGYRWRRAGSFVAGATGTTLAIPSATLADAALYDVLVNDGLSVTTSQPGRITVVPASVAGAYRLDPSFAPLFEYDYGYVYAVARAPDGGFYAGGSFTTIAGQRRHGLARFAADGTLVASFSPVHDGYIYGLVVQPDGRLVVGGSFRMVNGVARANIARLNADGTLDTSFDPGSGFSSTVQCLARQSDGKLVVGGYFGSFNGQSRSFIARLNADGSLDASFNPGSGASGGVQAVAVGTDGKVVLGGDFTSFNGVTRNRVARLNADGSLDAGFDPGEGPVGDYSWTYYVRTVAVQADGKVIAGGPFTRFGGQTAVRIVRLNANGTVDATFATGTGFSSDVQSLALQADGRVLVGGYFGTFNGTTRQYLARLNGDGTLDSTWASTSAPSDAVSAIEVAPDGRVLAGGYFKNVGATAASGVARFTSAGALDAAPTGALYSRGAVISVAPVTGGKWLVGGQFNRVNGTSRNHIARLNADGTLDAAFNPGTAFGSSYAYVYALGVQGDGKVVAGGYFTSYNGASASRLVRINPDGSRDATFDVGSGPNSDVYRLALQADGRVVVTGYFTTINGTARQRIARLAPDGSLDSTFATTSGLSDTASAVALQRDGRIVLAGYFTSVAGQTRNRLARLNGDGTLDSTFNAGAGFNSQLNGLRLQDDGRIAVGGYVSSYDGISFPYPMTRLNADGTLDSTFSQWTGASSYVSALAPAPGGRLLLAGPWFTAVNGAARNRVAVINADGSLEPAFAAYDTIEGQWVEGAQFADDGRLLVWGPSAVRGTNLQHELFMLKPDVAPQPVIVAQPTNQTTTIGGSATFTVAVTGDAPLAYQWRKNGIALSGATGSSLALTNVQVADVAAYTVTISNAFGSAASNAATLLDSNPAPVFAAQPQNVTVAAGQNASLSVTATGGGSLSYQWRRNGQAIAGATGATLSLGTATRALADSYDVVVYNGLTAATSQPARLAVAPTAYPQVLAADTAFNANFEVGGGQVQNFLRLSSGQVIVVGSFTRIVNTPARCVARLNADGTVDTTFASNVIDSTVNAVVAQSDGKLIIGGSFSTINGVSRSGLARLNADGTFDSTWAGGTQGYQTTNVLAFQSDGKLLVGGSFSNLLHRLNADGTRDTTFNPSPNSTIYALAVQADGRILTGGVFSSIAGNAMNRLARLNADGTLDPTFTVGSGFNSDVRALRLLADGRVIVGGFFGNYNGATASGLVRLTTTGAIDSTWAAGSGLGGGLYAIEVQADGKILLAGSFSSYNGTTLSNFARLLADGALDPTFAPAALNSAAFAVGLLNDGSILVGGFFSSAGTTSTIGLTRFATDGSGPVAGLAPGLMTVGTVNRIVPLAGGRVLVGGSFTRVNGATVPHLARLDSSGALDATFNSGGTGFGSSVIDFFVQGDGRIVVTGAFVGYNGVTRNRLARLNADGSLDTTFDPGAGPNTTLSRIYPLGGGRVLLVGSNSFTAYAGTSRIALAAVNADGSLDASFDAGSNNGSVLAAAVQVDGKIVVGGTFTSLNGVTRNRLARLLPTGALDTAFAADADNQINDVVLQPDGRIVVGGLFVTLNGAPRHRVARLNADGTFDSGWSPGTSASSTVSRLLVQEDGRIVLAGSFANVNGLSNTGRLARLLPDGSLDRSLAMPTLLSSPSALAMLDDGSLLVGGSYFRFNDTQRYGLFRATSSAGPVFTSQPGGTFTYSEGATITYSVAVAGGSDISYQWRKNGTAIPGANAPSFTLYQAQTADAGVYSVAVTHSGGTLISTDSTLSFVATAPGLNSSSISGFSGALKAGSRIVLFAPTVGIGTKPLTYQWTKDGVSMAGATGPSYAPASWQTADSGAYTVTVSNSVGSVTTSTYNHLVTDSADWTPRFPGPQNNPLLSVSYLNGRFVALGARGTVLTSTDGQAWTVSRLGVSETNPSLAYGNGTYVATFQSASVFTSTDAVNWTRRAPNLGSDGRQFSSNPNALTFGGGRFVAVGTLGLVVSSTDGVNWTVAPTATGDALSSVAYGAGKFVALGTSGRTITSTDGVTWSPGPVLPESVTHLAFGSGLFVAAQSSNYLYTSPDGVAWTRRTLPTTSSVRTVQFTGAGFLAPLTSTAPGEYVVSTDGLAWTKRQLNFNLAATANAMTFGAGRYVIAGNSPDTLFSSADGTTWTRAGFSSFFNFLAAAASPTIAVAVGTGGSYSSTDGTTWASRASGTSNQLNDVAFGAGKFVAVGTSGVVLTSADGSIWAIGTSGTTNQLRGVTFVNDRFIAAGDAGTLLASTDGLAWTALTSGTAQNLYRAAFGGGTYVVTGASGTVLTSTNGTAWTLRSTTITSAIQDIVFGNGLFVISPASHVLHTSPDGITWTARVNPLSYGTTWLAYAGGKFYAGSVLTLNFLTSTDGLTWTMAQHGSANSLTDLVSFGGTLFAVGNAGTILSAPPGPAITTQPVAQTATVGSSVTFTVAASGSGPFTYQWFKNGTAIAAATGASFTIASISAGDTGSYTVAVSNAAGTTLSSAAVLAVQGAVAPTITAHPQSQAVSAGQSVTFSVGASGSAPLNYQWKKGTTDIAGATLATYTIAAVATGDAGSYSVVVTNAAGSAGSNAATLTVLPAGFAATHGLVGAGYQPGGTVTITNTITYATPPSVSALGWNVLLPDGWSFAATTSGDSPPQPGDTSVLTWAWLTIPASPHTFTYTLNVPAGATGAQSLVALLQFRQNSTLYSLVAKPDPLVLNKVTFHSADTMGATSGSAPDNKISLAELLRVIELYNYRAGTVRTGQYTMQAGTEDGYAPGPAGAAITVYHSADTMGATPGTARDGKINLAELLRVIELYNYRSGTVRTGQYHVQAGTEDGFAPGP